MEFPDLGQHCSEVTCQQLDFLPLKCDACENIFCREHIAYKDHKCSSAYKKDVQVPVCPLCNSPVPLKKGETPDFVVGQHIDNDCQSDPAKSKRKVFSNKCSAKGCKVKEVIPVICNKCKLNFCLKHRHEVDHQCEGEVGAARRRATEAALARQKAQNGQSLHHQGSGPSGSKGPNSHMLTNGPFRLQNGGLAHPQKSSQLRSKQRATAVDVQGSMSEDEALARALALSMQETSQLPNQPNALNNSEQITNDFILARALAESEQSTSSARSSQNKCAVS